MIPEPLPEDRTLDIEAVYRRAASSSGTYYTDESGEEHLVNSQSWIDEAEKYWPACVRLLAEARAEVERLRGELHRARRTSNCDLPLHLQTDPDSKYI